MYKLAPFLLFLFLTACGGGGGNSNTTNNEPPDTTPPIITVNGGETTIAVGSAYNDLGATAIDNKDGAVDVTTTGTVDISTPGNYTVRYTATDVAGNTSSTTRTITVRSLEEELKANAIKKINDYSVNQSNPTPTEADYKNAEVTGVSQENIEKINEHIIKGINLNTTDRIQGLVNKIMDSISLVTVEPDRTNSEWTYIEFTSSLTQNKIGLLTLKSTNISPTYRVRCSEGFSSFHLKTDFITGNGLVQHRFGTDNVILEDWDESAENDFRVLFPPLSSKAKPEKFTKTSDIVFSISKFRGGRNNYTFENYGFYAMIEGTRDICGWTIDDYPINNRWGKAYPATPPNHAKESTYTNHQDRFRMIAWIDQNTSGENQLLVRIGDQVEHCVVGNKKIKDGRLYVLQDELKIPVLAASAIDQDCDKPGIYALQGQFDTNRQFILTQFDETGEQTISSIQLP